MKQVLSVVTLLFIVEGIEHVGSDQSVIIYSSAGPIDGNHLVKTVNDILELKCMSNENQRSRWVVPSHLQNRVTYSAGLFGSAIVTIKHLLLNDTGKYMCEIHDAECLHGGCTSHNATSTATVHLHVKSKTCSGFQCNPTICISDRFTCDGKFDCPNKEDEAPLLCGVDPCLNKIKCNDRCIPQEWCCINVKNCTRKWNINCCPNGGSFPGSGIMRYLGSSQHYNDHYKSLYNNPNITYYRRNLSDYTVLHNLFRTVRGYALVLFVIGPIILIGLYRVYTRQRSYRQYQHGTALLVAPRIIHRNSTYVTTVTYHPSNHIETAEHDGVRSLVLNQTEALVRNNTVGIVFDNCGNIRSEEPPPYYDDIYPEEDDNQPPPYSSTIDQNGGNESTSEKIAEV